MGVAKVISENGWMFGGPEQHLGVVGASALKLGGPMGEVDSEQSLDGERSSLERELSRSCVPADWTCVESYDDGACGGVGAVPQSPCTLIGALSHQPGHVPSSADNRELAELRIRYDNGESLRLRKRLWAFVEYQVLRSSPFRD